ncbi:2-Hydroxyacid oxidase 1-like [Amphiura filiformis]|uniref:2-Hydroxyacid oxidase 1-like n=1 Tax=Amphiura filiformis TaxID=82378 RepID=UPI003B210998
MSTLVCIQDYEDRAKEVLPAPVFNHYVDHADEGQTMDDCKEAFKRYRLRPRVLRDVSNRQFSTTILGHPVSFPICISPTAGQQNADIEGDKATARDNVMPKRKQGSSAKKDANKEGWSGSFSHRRLRRILSRFGHIYQTCTKSGCTPLMISGTIACAKTAKSLDTIMIVSTGAIFTCEDIALAAPNAMLWFQIHLFKDRQMTRFCVRQAERAGFTAVVVTIDTPVIGSSRSMKRRTRNAPREQYRLIMPLKHSLCASRHLIFQNGKFYDPNNPEVRSAIANGDVALSRYSIEQIVTAETWEGIKWLRGITKLPIVVKGVLTGDSSIEAVQAGVDAILVSAHGGRQLDGVPATIDALPEVVKAVKGSGVEVYMDGGVRQGTDVFKALALGARAVFLGRPVLWGLAIDGENGVKKVLELVRDEFSLTMALAGCSKLDDIKASMVVHESQYLSKL